MCHIAESIERRLLLTTEVGVVANQIVISDADGADSNDDWTITADGTQLTIADNNGRPIDLTGLLDGGTGDNTATVTVPLASGSAGVQVNPAAGNDVIRIGAATLLTNQALDVNDGTGLDSVHVDGVIQTKGGSVQIDASGNIHVGGMIVTSGGQARFHADRDGDGIGFFRNTAVIDTTGAVDGDVVLQAADVEQQSDIIVGTANVSYLHSQPTERLSLGQPAPGPSESVLEPGHTDFRLALFGGGSNYFSPDDRYVLYGLLNAAGRQTVLRRVSVSTGEDTLLTAPALGANEGISNIFFTPDSSRIVYTVFNWSTFRKTGLRTVSIDGGPDTQLNAPLNANEQIGTVLLTSTGSHVVFGIQNSARLQTALRSVPVTGGAVTTLPVTLQSGESIASVQTSPDNSTVVYEVRDGSFRTVALRSIQVDGTSDQQLNNPLSSGQRIWMFQMNPTGDRIVYVKGTSTQRTELRSVPTRGGTDTLLNSPLPAGWQLGSVRFASSGIVVYDLRDSSFLTVEIRHVPINGGADLRLNSPLSGGEFMTQIDLRNDRSVVFYTVANSARKVVKLRKVAVGGGPDIQLNAPFAGGEELHHFQLTADESRVVYSVRDSAFKIVALRSVPAAGGSDIELTRTPAGDQIAQFQTTADNRNVVYQIRNSSFLQTSVRSVSIEGAGDRQLSAPLRGEDRILSVLLANGGARVVYSVANTSNRQVELRTVALDSGIDRQLDVKLAADEYFAGLELNPEQDAVYYSVRNPSFLNTALRRNSLRDGFILSDAELDRTVAGSVSIGESSSGDVVVAEPVSPARTSQLNITSSAQIASANIDGTDIAVESLMLNGDLAPGQSPGTFRVDGDLTLADGSTFSAEIGGSAAGEEYDQLAVNGMVTIGSAVSLDVSLINSFAPTISDSFVLINNMGSQSVSGEFDGLPHGSSVRLGSVDFVLSYNGGDGNDVVLAVPETSVRVAGNQIVVTDANGGVSNDDWTLTADGVSLTITSNDGSLIDLTESLDGGEGDLSRSVSVPLAAGRDGIVLNSVAGNDVLRIGATTLLSNQSLTVNGGSGVDSALVEGSLSTSGGTLEIAVSTDISVEGAIVTDGGNATFSADNDADGEGVFRNTATINTTGSTDGTVVVSSSDVKLNAAIDAGGADVSFVHSQAGEAVTFGHPSPEHPLLLNAPLAAGDTIAQVRLTPDGTHMVYMIQNSSFQVYAIRSVPTGGGPDILLSAPVGSYRIVHIQFSPDSKYLIYRLSDGSRGNIAIRSVPVAGGTDNLLSASMPSNQLIGQTDITADSSAVIFTAQNSSRQNVAAWSVPIDGGTGTVLTDQLAPSDRIVNFQLTSDSKTIVYWLINSSNAYYALRSAAIDGSRDVRLSAPLRFGDDIASYRISPDNEFVTYLVRNRSRGIIELKSVSLSTGSIQTLNETVKPDHQINSHLRITDSGQVVYDVDSRSPGNTHREWRRVPVSGGIDTRLNLSAPPGQQLGSNLQFTADESRFVYRIQNSSFQTLALRTMAIADNVDRPLNAPLSTNNYMTFLSRPAPGSSHYLYQVEDGARKRIKLHSVNFHTGADVRLNAPLNPGEQVFDFLVTPDGAYVVYSLVDASVKRVALYGVPVEGGTPVLLTAPLPADRRIYVFRMGADGKNVVYSVADDSQRIVAVRSVQLDGGPDQQLSEPLREAEVLSQFQLSNDGKNVIYQVGNRIFSAALSDGFSLTDTELDRVSAGRITVGEADDGDVVIAEPISPAGTNSLAIVTGGTISDVGDTGPDVTVGLLTLHGNVAPGQSPGILSVDGNQTLTTGSALSVEIGGTIAGTEYDQLQVSGLTDLNNATLNVSLIDSFTPIGSDEFVIVDNTHATHAIRGTFNGLPEGAIITLAGIPFSLTYRGGDGNDVVLQNDPPALQLHDLSYTEDQNSGNPVQLDTSALITDAEGDAEWNGGSLSVQISNNSEATDEVSIPDNVVGMINTDGTNLRSGSTIIGTLSAAEGIVTGSTMLTITFNNNTTNAHVQDVLRAVSYRTTSDSPAQNDRTLKIIAADKHGQQCEKTATVTVAGRNDVSVSFANTRSVPEGRIATRVKVADVVITDTDGGINQLSLSGADSAFFTLVGTELFLLEDTRLDFETRSALTVMVGVDDTTIPGSPDEQAPFTLQVIDVNEPPVVQALRRRNQLLESVVLNESLKVADINVVDDALGDETLSLTGADASVFELKNNNSELHMKAGTPLDFETQAFYHVTVQADDATLGGNPDSSVDVVLQILDVFEPPEADLSVDGTDVANFGVVDFGAVTTGMAPPSRTFKLTNTGTGDLVVQPVTVPAGYTLTSPNFAVGQTVPPGDSASFTVKMNTAAAGGIEGNLQFATNDQNESIYKVRLSGAVLEPSATPDELGGDKLLIDNGDIGFLSVGGWANVANYGYGTDAAGRDARSANNVSGVKKSYWAFKDLTPGLFNVSTTWLNGGDRSDAVPITIRDGAGGPILASLTLNEKSAPDGPLVNGRRFQMLDRVSLSGTVMVVEMSTEGTTGAVIADAVMIQAFTPPPATPELTVRSNGSLVEDGTQAAFRTVGVGGTSSRTFFVRNEGTADLTVQPITLTGSVFSLTSPNFSAGQKLAPGATVPVSVDVDTTTAGNYNGTLSFASDDADESPFDLTLFATVRPAGSTDIVVDDGDADFLLSGNWMHVPGYGFKKDAKAIANNRSGTASWTFTGLTPGNTELSATWLPGGDRWDAVPYVIRDGIGGPILRTVAVNQQKAPSGSVYAGRAFQSFGTVSHSSDTLVVEVSNAGAAGAVVADAVRIVSVTPPPGSPEIDVLQASLSVLDDGSFSFQSVEQGDPALTKPFTVKNTGTADLTLSPVSVTGTGYSLIGPNFTSGQVLAPSQSATFTVGLTTSTPGNFSGHVSFLNNDSDESPFNFALTGSINVPSPPGVYIVDDGDTGFRATGTVRTVNNFGYANDMRTANGINGEDTARWVFTDLDAGDYDVAVTWQRGGDRSTAVTYIVRDGIDGNVLTTVTVDQTKNPIGAMYGRRLFETLDMVTVTDTLVVEVSTLGTVGTTIMDAVRIQKRTS